MTIEEILTQRGISEEIISRLGWRVIDDWLEMPVIQRGEEVGYKRRKFGDDKAFTQKKGTPQIFYNWDALEAASNETLIITEGEMDCAIALQCGFLAVSVPNGAPAEQIDEGGKKYAYIDDLPDSASVILAFDNDHAGDNLLHDVSIRIGKARCKWVKYPKGCKDLNEAFIKYGHRGVCESIQRAQWMQVSGLVKLQELPPARDLVIVPCPVEGMNDLYKLRLGDFAVVTGIPGMGKTTFVNEIAAQIAKIHGWNICIGSFEQHPMEDLIPWIRSHYHLKSKLNTGEIEEADDWLQQKFSFIIPTPDEDIDLHWLIDRIEAAAVRHDAKLVIVDPWNELDHIHPPGMSQTEYTGFAIRQLKKLASRLKIHLIVVTHPAKMSRNKDGEYPVPSLYDIADSAHWRNKCDMGIVVHRTDDKTSKIIVAKCRHWGKTGRVGEAELRYDDYRFKFVTVQNYG